MGLVWTGRRSDQVDARRARPWNPGVTHRHAVNQHFMGYEFCECGALRKQLYAGERPGTQHEWHACQVCRRAAVAR